MPLGSGYWLDRRLNRLHRIGDHAGDACANPALFGLTNADLLKVTNQTGYRAVIRNEVDREAVIIRVAEAGYLRIRHHKEHLGWQFAGDPLSALKSLRSFAPKLGLGPMTIVTFTDFGLGRTVTDCYHTFHDETSVPLQLLLAAWVSRYEKPTK